ncbi:MAG: hypothetical protein WBB28_14500 [Crinalium sp.]
MLMYSYLRRDEKFRVSTSSANIPQCFRIDESQEQPLQLLYIRFNQATGKFR